MESLWRKTAEMPSFGPLKDDLQTDVLIIGGGMAGLLCAYKLEKAGVDYALVEADRICGGTTGNTTAKITSQHGMIYHKMIKHFGVEKARLYLEANQAALEEYRALCCDIDCGFEEQEACVYTMDDREKAEREAEAVRSLGLDAGFTTDLGLAFGVAGAVVFPGQAMFNPLAFASAISRDLNIYERTKVRQLAHGLAVTDRGNIRAKKIIVATHFPMLNKHGGYFIKLYQHRSYVIALEGAPKIGAMYLDDDEKGLSFRGSGDLLLIGGGSHRTGKRGGGWRELEDFAARYYPKARVTARWAAQDCMSLDGAPYIGEYSSGAEGLYVATGFNKWGMTSSMAAANILADMVQGKRNKYQDVFSPSRTALRPQLALNGLESLVSLLTPTAPRCPHMGCALKYNPEEHSWDCPCHGSRFTEEGELIEGPSTDDKRL